MSAINDASGSAFIFTDGKVASAYGFSSADIAACYGAYITIIWFLSPMDIRDLTVTEPPTIH